MASIAGAQVFYIVDLIFGAVSALLAFLVAYYALRGYMLTRNRTSLFFSSSFLLIAAGLLSRVVFDYISKFEHVYSPQFLALLGAAPILSAILFTSVFFMSAGYAFLIALFFKIRSKRVILLLVTLVGLLAAFSNDNYLQVHVIPALLLFFVQLHTFENFVRRRTHNTLLVLASFLLLFVSELFFLLIGQSMDFYFFGTTLRLLGYLLLLANVFLVFKR